MKNKKKGYLIWITGISGSGKSTIAKKIIKKISNKIGPTLLFNGDDVRKIFKLNSYNISSRKDIAFKYSKLCKFINNQGFNILFATVSMFNDVRKFNRKNNRLNYIEIFIKSPLEKIIENKKKKIYFSNKKVVGRNLKSEFPKRPDILIINDFSKNIDKIAQETFKKILKKIQK